MKRAKNTSSALGRKLRGCRGIRPAREIAEVLGITQQTLTGYERGRAEPDCTTLARLARHYGVTTDWLLDVKPPRHIGNDREADASLIRRLVEIEADACAKKLELLAKAEPCRN